MLDEESVRASLAWTARTFADLGMEYAVWSGGAEVVLRNVRLFASARRSGLVPDVAIEAVMRLCGPEGTGLLHG